jgi:hypothetical protein
VFVSGVTAIARSTIDDICTDGKGKQKSVARAKQGAATIRDGPFDSNYAVDLNWVLRGGISKCCACHLPLMAYIRVTLKIAFESGQSADPRA